MADLNLIEKISARLEELTRSERKVAEAALSNPQLTSTETIADLARRSQVSEPTVYRFCKSFGFEGFPEFKTALALCLEANLGRQTVNVQLGASVADIAEAVFKSSTSVLSYSASHLDLSAVARAVDLTAAARRLVIAAALINLPQAYDFKVRLLRLGITSEIYEGTESQLMAAASLKSTDLLIVIDSSGTYLPLLKAAETARGSWAQVLSLAPQDSKLAAAATLNLELSSSENFWGDELLCFTAAAHALVQIIVTCVMLRRGSVLEEGRKRIAAVQRTLYEEDERAPLTDNKQVEAALDPTAPITAVSFDF